MSSLFWWNASQPPFLCISCALLGSVVFAFRQGSQTRYAREARNHVLDIGARELLRPSPDSRRRERSSSRRVQFRYLTGGR
ncbi:unnamed protein product, partial [Ectocarpus sp. 12 AP-2014]